MHGGGIMKNKALAIVITTVFCIAALIIFRNFFTPGPLAAGDAPFFVQSALHELITEPLGWTYRGINFGGVNQFLWISPLMVLYGLFGTIFGNDVAIRLLFYFPSLACAGIGIFLLTKYFKLNLIAKVFALALYILNTYYILLVDGGQVGIALAYGVFPLTIYVSLNFLEKRTFQNFIIALLTSGLLMLVEPRVFIIQILFVALLSVFEKKWLQLRYLLLIAVPIVLINTYWLLPLFVNGTQSLSTEVSELQLTSILNGLLLYQPHWYENIFGKITYPAFYFVLFPIIFLWGVLKNKNKSYYALFFLFLVFAFLLKGQAAPAGFIYSKILDLPLGFAFRDSSKFFIPLLLSASLMLGFVAHKLKSNLTTIVISLLILIGVMPAIRGNLQFVLGNQNTFANVNEHLQNKIQSGRVAWFPFKPATGIETNKVHSIDARELTDFHIFANNNAGSFDHFNYMRNMNYQDWFKLLGINSLVLAGDTRNINLSVEEQKSWSEFKDYINSSEGITKEAVRDVSIYTLENAQPRLLGTQQLVAVIGPDTIASPNILSAYMEDGVFESHVLDKASADSIVLYFNNRKEQDLQMSLLQSHYKSTQEARNSQWSQWSSNQYLQWKYELLVREMDIKELDYRKGIAFSTQSNEAVSWDFEKLKSEEYILAIRTLGNNDSQLSAQINEKSYTINPDNTFGWFVQDMGNISGDHKLSLINQSGISVVNVIALIPKKDFDIATNKAKDYINKFKRLTDREYQALAARNNWIPFEFNETSQYEFSTVVPQNVKWIFMSDRYSPLWQVRIGGEYYPSTAMYSYFNGFNVPTGATKADIVFSGQKTVRWGLYLSGISAAALVAVLLYYLSKHESQNN